MRKLGSDLTACRYLVVALLLVVILFASISSPSSAQAAGASLTFLPNQGGYVVDSTFDVSLTVDTGGQAINAVEAFVRFPADKLQVVSPSVSSSFISFWVAGPSYSNTSGTITFQGGLPHPGVTTTAGVISTIKFRVKSSGKAVLKYETNSRVLADDGVGTNILSAQSQATYDIKLPPPAGPVVSSPSHEDSNKWYNNRAVILNWESPGASDYSFILDTNALTVPDEQSDSTATTLTKTVEYDGRWYFHIRAKNKDGWGGTTHFLARIDGSPPAHFKPGLQSGSLRADERGLATFATTDAASGVDHFEIKIISSSAKDGEATLFVEQHSPYQLPSLTIGQYELIVRAFDVAGNYTDETLPFSVVSPALPRLGRLPLFGSPWVYNLLFGLLLLTAITFFVLWWRRRRNHNLRQIATEVARSNQEIQAKQQQLQKLIGEQRTVAQNLAQPTTPPPPQ